MKILELFAGSRSIGKVAEELGYEVFSSDINDFKGIDYVVNILDFDINRLPWIPDAIWASIPCTTFSMASCGHHWNKDRTPKTIACKTGILIAKKTIEIVKHYQGLNKKLTWFYENPMGLLRKMSFMPSNNPIFGTYRHTITYCQYETNKPPEKRRMKSTDIWTNSNKWIPRPSCKNGDPCHEAAPRGSRTGTQGIKGAYARSIIPRELCLEILTSI